MELTTELDAIKGETNLFQGDADTSIAANDQMWFTLKRRKADPDTSSVVTKGPALNGSQGIALLDSAQGIYEVTLAPADTQNLKDRALLYDIKLKTTANGQVQTLTSGVLLLVDGVRVATP